MYRCVVFDLDGTVLNTLEGLADAGNYALSQMKLPTHPTESYRRFVGNGIPKLIERMLPKDADKAAFLEAYEMFRSYYNIHMNDKTVPYPGIPELLKALKEKGVKLALVSNKAHEFAAEMIERYFPKIFDVVFGSVEGFPKKPDPYWVLRALETLAVKPDEVFYVGDSGVDMQTAQRAGLTACGVLWGFRDQGELEENGADIICGDPEKLFTLITAV